MYRPVVRHCEKELSLFVWFVLFWPFYAPVNNFSHVGTGLHGLNQQAYLPAGPAQGHSTVTPPAVRLELYNPGWRL